MYRTPKPQASHTVHVVQRMAPGGIETFVLDLARQTDWRNSIVSLEGTRAGLIDGWPALAAVSDRVVALGARAGVRPRLVSKLASTFRSLGPTSVMLHHIGPLLYGGLAARLAGVSRIIYVEHDVWHYAAAPRHRTIVRGMERLLKPKHVCQSAVTAARLGEILPGADIATIQTGIDCPPSAPMAQI